MSRRCEARGISLLCTKRNKMNKIPFSTSSLLCLFLFDFLSNLSTLWVCASSHYTPHSQHHVYGLIESIKYTGSPFRFLLIVRPSLEITRGPISCLVETRDVKQYSIYQLSLVQLLCDGIQPLPYCESGQSCQILRHQRRLPGCPE